MQRCCNEVIIQSQIAEEEGIFTLDDVVSGIRDKMIRRHPHVFGNANVNSTDEVLTTWEAIKAKEKEGKEDVSGYLGAAFDEAEEMIEAARKRKGLKPKK